MSSVLLKVLSSIYEDGYLVLDKLVLNLYLKLFLILFLFLYIILLIVCIYWYNFNSLFLLGFSFVNVLFSLIMFLFLYVSVYLLEGSYFPRVYHMDRAMLFSFSVLVVLMRQPVSTKLILCNLAATNFGKSTTRFSQTLIKTSNHPESKQTFLGKILCVCTI